jgi:hypothetical protein
MKKVIIAIFCASMISPQIYAQSYGIVRQTCSMKQDSGKAKKFSCRVMTNGANIIFIDNYDTDDRYIVGAPEDNVSSGEYYRFKVVNKKCIRLPSAKVTICELSRAAR